MIWWIVGHLIIGFIIYSFLIYDVFKQFGYVTVKDLYSLLGFFLGGFGSLLIILFLVSSYFVTNFKILKKKKK
jgi:hypothetical protein